MLKSETSLLHDRTIDRLNAEKLYIQLTRIFLDEITSGNWQLDEKIPSEDSLCKMYRVSKITVRQALNNLAADGYLMKIQGKGTFVTSVTPLVGATMRTRLTEDMFGEEVKAEKEVLMRGTIVPSDAIRTYLKTDQEIFHVLCRRIVSNQPAYLDESFVPYTMISNIDAIDFTNESFYAVLQERASRKVFKVIQTIEVMQVPHDLSGYLELKPTDAVLAVHRLLQSSDDTPVAYTRFLGRIDRYKFQTEFERIR